MNRQTARLKRDLIFSVLLEESKGRRTEIMKLAGTRNIFTRLTHEGTMSFLNVILVADVLGYDVKLEKRDVHTSS